MQMSSLVVTLASDPERRQHALRTLRLMPGVYVGDASRVRVPVVLETETLQSGYEFVEQHLRSIDGVVFVDVVRVDFDNEDGGAWNDDAFS